MELRMQALGLSNGAQKFYQLGMPLACLANAAPHANAEPPAPAKLGT